MAAFYEWVRNIVICLLVISLIFQLLPDSGYKKYMRVCAGLVLIVVAMTPVLKLFGEDIHLSYFFELESLRAELETISYPDELYAADQARRQQMTENYKAQLEAGALAMFEGETPGLAEIDITVETDEASEDFGRVSAVWGRAGTQPECRRAAEKIEPVVIGESRDGMTGAAGTASKDSNMPKGRGDLVPAEYADDIFEMRQRLADYLCTDISAITLEMSAPEMTGDDGR